MSEIYKVYYLGDDEAYFKAIQSEFAPQAKASFKFMSLFESDEKKIQSLFIQIFNDQPACILIDFSKYTAEYLHLARLMARTPSEKPVLMIGLVDYLSPTSVLKEGLLSGCNLCYIKSAETYDVAFSIAKNIAPKVIGEHGFAIADLKEEVEAGVLCKVGYIHPLGLHIETDQALSKGEWLTIDHFWTTKRIVPSKKVFVQKLGNSDLFYQYKQSADLNFLFEDEPVFPEGMPEDKIKHRLAEREENIRYHKKMLVKWIEEHKSDSSPKRAKVLVVDSSFRFYQDQTRTDKHSYTIRCLPHFNDIAEELTRYNPQIIIYEIQKDDEENAQNTLANLKQLINVQSTMFNDMSPFIIVFNSPMNSVELQTYLEYPQIIAHGEIMDPALVLRMADALQKKLSTQTATVAESQKMFLKKNHPSSVIEIKRSITVKKVSETDIIFESSHPFVSGTNLHFTKPVEMYVNVRPSGKSGGKVQEFYGFIHGIGELEKKELRRYVNAIFFRDHDAQVAAETEEFKKLNASKLQEKINQVIKAQEEKLKEAEKTKKPEDPVKSAETEEN